MRKFVFTCSNNECESKVMKLRTFTTSTGTVTKVSKDDQFLIEREDGDTTKRYCPYCDYELKELGEQRTVFLGTTLLSSQQKQKMLLERSLKHERTAERRDDRAEIMLRNKREYGI